MSDVIAGMRWVADNHRLMHGTTGAVASMVCIRNPLTYEPETTHFPPYFNISAPVPESQTLQPSTLSLYPKPKTPNLESGAQNAEPRKTDLQTLYLTSITLDSNL
jgi:hypothetical protein